jgi:hypothetical protein
VTLATGEGERDIQIPLCQDKILSEPPETINLSITGEVRLITTAVLTISETPFRFSISGRVKTPAGRGLWPAQVRLQGPGGSERYAFTHGSFGWYTFDNLDPGAYHLFRIISAPKHTFAFQQYYYIFVDRDLRDVDFVADPLH